MATITIRNLDEKVKRKLQVRAALNGRSMEAEARACLAILVGEDKPSAGAEEDFGTAIRRLVAPFGRRRAENSAPDQIHPENSHV
ncbi:MAG: plasmid stabilization protein [Terracidiphilus sp.]|jgi:plasmid stability protein